MSLTPGAARELFSVLSPLTSAENITTPLLLLHSDQDHRCPGEQAEQLFTRLRLLGRDVSSSASRTGRTTGAAGPPRQRVFRFQTILDWFNRYL